MLLGERERERESKEGGGFLGFRFPGFRKTLTVDLTIRVNSQVLRFVFIMSGVPERTCFMRCVWSVENGGLRY